MRRALIKDNLRTLDSLRGFAAIYVLIHHPRWILLKGHRDGYSLYPGRYSLFNKIPMYFFPCFKSGNEAVIFFFILSGFAMKTHNGDLPSHFLYAFATVFISIIISWLLHLIGEKSFTKK